MYEELDDVDLADATWRGRGHRAPKAASVGHECPRRPRFELPRLGHAVEVTDGFAGLGKSRVCAQQIITREIENFLSRSEAAWPEPVNLDVRIAFNPNLTSAWFMRVMAVINNVTMLAIILAGAAIVREREHGTMDHLLVMPLTPFEIAMSKIWSNGLVITVAVALSLVFVIRGALGVPIAGRSLSSWPVS
jgi:hypothetical protein